LQGDAQWPALDWVEMDVCFRSDSAILFLIFLFLVPETPRYLVMKGKTSAASVFLHKLLDRQEAEKNGRYSGKLQEKGAFTSAIFQIYGGLVAYVRNFIAALELLGNTNALELALIFSFVISLIFPIRSFGVVIIMVGILLSAFQQFVG
jgi:SP family xylose:H+ symportor-like MFS transporter